MQRKNATLIAPRFQWRFASSEYICLNLSLRLKATAITQIKYNTNKKLGKRMPYANLLLEVFNENPVNKLKINL